ncbi:DALR anticodon-binding domain-containing protein, partial [Acinetobacter baumannii]
QPGRIARFAFDVANDLQKFYEVSRVITDDAAATRASLGLIIATKQVLANALAVIGVSAPERM